MIRKAIATSCCIGMAATGVVAGSTAATGVVAGSTAATADTGAVRSFPINTLGAGWTSVSYVDAPGNGYVYVHGQRNGDDGYAVVTESGEGSQAQAQALTERARPPTISLVVGGRVVPGNVITKNVRDREDP